MLIRTSALFEGDNTKYLQPSYLKTSFFQALAYLADEEKINKAMDTYLLSLRNALLTDTGESLSEQKEKIFYSIIQLNAILSLLNLQEIESNKNLLYLYYSLENSTTINDAVEVHENITKLLVSSTLKQSTSHNEESEVVKKSKAYINSNLTKKLSTKTIAKEVNYDQDYISHCFKRELNTTVSEYILSKKIKASLSDLASGMPIILVSDKYSFSSQSYFTQKFREITGLTPREYQKWIVTSKFLLSI